MLICQRTQPQSTAVLTPPNDVDGKKGVSRRRSVLNTTLASEIFLEAKKLSLDAMSRDAGEEHNKHFKPHQNLCYC